MVLSIDIAILAGVVLLIVLVVLLFLVGRKKDSPPAPPAQPPPEPSDERTVQYSRLVLGDVEEPIAVVEPLEASIEVRRVPLSVDKQQLKGLQSILRHAPRLAKSASNPTTNTYTLKFSPEVAQGIRSGYFDVMKSAGGGLRGVVVDTQGKIVSHATLVPASGIKMAAVAAGAFQILAVVTAQYYLPQINRRLLKIEQGIQDIQAHLIAQDKAILVDNLKQLKSMKLLLEKGVLRERNLSAIHTSLDTIDSDSGRALEAYRDHMKRYKDELDTVNLSGMFEPNFAGAIDKATQYETAAFVSLQAMYVKSVTAQLRCVVLGSYDEADDDLRDLETALEAWCRDQDSFSQRFKERIRDDTIAYLDLGDLGEILGKEVSLTKQRKKIIDEADDRQTTITGLHDEFKRSIDQATERVARQLAASSEPITLAVELDEQGQIEHVYELSETTQEPRQ